MNCEWNNMKNRPQTAEIGFWKLNCRNWVLGFWILRSVRFGIRHFHLVPHMPSIIGTHTMYMERLQLMWCHYVFCDDMTVGGREIKGDASASSCCSWSQEVSARVVTHETAVQPLRLTPWWRAVVPDRSVPTHVIIPSTHALETRSCNYGNYNAPPDALQS